MSSAVGQGGGRATPSLREGLESIPTLAGAWVLLLITRVHLGTALGNEQLASFSLAWTAADLAFLVSVTLITTASTAIMDGTESALRMFGRATGIALLLLVLGSLAVPVALLVFAKEGYAFSYSLLALTGVATVGRLAISAWLPVSVRHRSVWTLSELYVGAAVTLVVVFSLWSFAAPDTYAAGLAFACVAVGLLHAAIAHRRRNPQALQDAEPEGR